MFQKHLLSGKRILITGGATGLGKSMGHRFLELGAATLYICGRREQQASEQNTARVVEHCAKAIDAQH